MRTSSFTFSLNSFAFNLLIICTFMSFVCALIRMLYPLFMLFFLFRYERHYNERKKSGLAVERPSSHLHQPHPLLLLLLRQLMLRYRYLLIAVLFTILIMAFIFTRYRFRVKFSKRAGLCYITVMTNLVNRSCFPFLFKDMILSPVSI